MTLARDQFEVEKALSDVLPHGIREGIAKGIGIYPKIVDAFFNPFDERKSPYFSVLHIQSVIDSLDPATGDLLWQMFHDLRDESKPHGAGTRHLNPDHELGELTREVAEIVVARCNGRPVSDQLREIAEAERQLSRYKDSILETLGRAASATSESVN